MTSGLIGDIESEGEGEARTPAMRSVRCGAARRCACTTDARLAQNRLCLWDAVCRAAPRMAEPDVKAFFVCAFPS